MGNWFSKTEVKEESIDFLVVPNSTKKQIESQEVEQQSIEQPSIEQQQVDQSYCNFSEYLIKESTIPHISEVSFDTKGVFTEFKIKEGTLLFHSESPNGQKVNDAAMNMFPLIEVNDPKLFCEKLEQVWKSYHDDNPKVNAKLDNGFYVASRNIEADEEIMTAYGFNYWIDYLKVFVTEENKDGWKQFETKYGNFW